MNQPDLDRFADLAIAFGANVQPGQIVAIGTEPGKELLTRALVASAYRHGAKFVDVAYFDLHVKRARLLNADPDTLDFVPSWYGNRMLELGKQRCARIGLSGPAFPGLLEDVDPQRAGRDLLPAVKEGVTVVNEATTNWTAIPCPTRNWATLVYPDLDPDAAYDKLVADVVHTCRLDEDDPIAAWTERVKVLKGAAAALNERGFDALRFRSEGTDLTVGLLPTSTFMAATMETVGGITHMANLPSEEVFTAPDPQRVDGVVRSTKPLLLGGSIISGLEVEFRDGRAVRIDAQENVDVLRGYVARDDGAARLGEVALVDDAGRIGPLDTVFFDTLLDENAASHVALGAAYTFTAGPEDQDKVNVSSIHIDFMIGSSDQEVDGLSSGGEAVPVLRGGSWQI